MKLRVTCLLLAVLAVFPLLTAVVPAPAQAQMADHTTTPLMVIRFNQPRIYFQRPLYNAVSRALQAKPSVMFNLINYMPKTDDAKAQQDLQAVLNTLNEMGVPRSRIAVSNEADPSLRFSEVHVYVR
jgi:hypothetical protein